MSEFNITVEGGSSVRLPTAGKYCDRDIVVTAQGGGDTSNEDMLITQGSIPYYKNDRVETIARYVFYRRDIKDVSFPRVKSVGDHSFQHTSILYLLNDNFPELETIGVGAFSYNQTYAVNLKNVKTVYGNAFDTNQSLHSLVLPSAEEIWSEAFNACDSLKTVTLPNVKDLGIKAFYRCTSLEKIELPNLVEVANNTFENCTKLRIVDLLAVKSINNKAFLNCQSLAAVVIRNEETVVEVAFDAFDGTPIFEGGMQVYIPTSMYEAYRQLYEPFFEANGLTGFFDILFRKLEDYTIDGTISGALDEDKI